MPAVPYNPAPSVSPSSGGTPYLRVPGGVEEAAGAGTARAVQGLGRSVDQVGDVLEKHVLALQGLQNETDAKNADVEAMIKIGQAQSEFDQLEGDNAVKALPGHMERIKAIRQESLDTMPNPVARKMLDQSISRRVGFAIVDSGHRAGTQAKVANDQASSARVDTIKRTFDLANANTAKLGKQALEAEIRQKGEERGMRPETIDNIIKKEYAITWLGGIQKLAVNQPQRANDLFEDMKDQLDPQVREQAQAIVNRGMASHQTRIDAQEIMSKTGFDPMKGAGQEEKLMKAAEAYKEKNKNNPDYADYLDSRVNSLYATGMKGYRDKQNGFEQDIGKFILGQDDANKVVSIDGLVGPNAPPEIRAAYEGLEPGKQKKVLGWVRQMADGGARTLTPERLLKERELKGMASDPESAEEFVNLGPDGIIKSNLTPGQTRGLLELQRKIGTSPKFIDSFVNKAMKQASVEGMLNAAGITKSRRPEQYFQFRGAFEDVIRDSMGDKNILPPPKELEAMASRLMQDQYKDQWWRFSSKVFEGGGMTDTIKTEITQEYKSRGIANPTDEQVARAYSLILYKRLYGDQPKAAKGNRE